MNNLMSCHRYHNQSENVFLQQHSGLNPLYAKVKFYKVKLQNKKRATFFITEREGFEPSEPVRAQRFSRPPDSTALASLQ